MDRGAWRATVHGGPKRVRHSEWLGTEHFHLVGTPLLQCIFPLWIPGFSMNQFSKSSKKPPPPAQPAMISCKAAQPQYWETVPLIWHWTQDCFERLFSFLFILMLLLCKEQEGQHQTDIGIISGLSFTGLQTCAGRSFPATQNWLQLPPRGEVMKGEAKTAVMPSVG